MIFPLISLKNWDDNRGIPDIGFQVDDEDCSRFKPLLSRCICDASHRHEAEQSLYHFPIPCSEPSDLRVGLCQDGNVSGLVGNIQCIPPAACTGGFD
jgi:hypothetical protein